MTSWPWRYAVLLLLILVTALGALSYHERKPTPVRAIWSQKWLGSHWPQHPIRIVRYQLPELP